MRVDNPCVENGLFFCFVGIHAPTTSDWRSITVAASCSPLPYIGNKQCIEWQLLAITPPHDTYIEPCMGSAEFFFFKPPSKFEILNDFDGDLVNTFRVIQQSEPLTYLVGRLYMSINSEQLFKLNRELLLRTPNILDDLKENAEIIKAASWEDVQRAAAFFENHVYSFSSTGQAYGIDSRDMGARIARILAVVDRLRNASILHRDYKDAILYGAREGAYILCDPPYKGTEGMYPKGSFEASEHENLFRFFYENVHKAFDGACKFTITYNDCPMIRELAENYGFFTLGIDRLHNMRQRVDAGGQFHELLVANYDMEKQAEENHQLHLIKTSQLTLFG